METVQNIKILISFNQQTKGPENLIMKTVNCLKKKHQKNNNIDESYQSHCFMCDFFNNHSIANTLNIFI